MKKRDFRLTILIHWVFCLLYSPSQAGAVITVPSLDTGTLWGTGSLIVACAAAVLVIVAVVRLVRRAG